MDVYEILCQWTDQEDLDRFLNDTQALTSRISKDDEIRVLMYNMREYLEETADDPSLLQSQDHLQKSREFYDRATYIFNRWAYGYQTRLVMNEARWLLNTIAEDTTMQKVRYDLQMLMKHMTMNEQGRFDLSVTQEVLDSFQQMIVPALLHSFAGVRLPKIEGVSDPYTYSIEGLMFPGYELLPEQFTLKAKQNIQLHARKPGQKNYALLKLALQIKDVSAHLNDIKFAFQRKGNLGLQDAGLADVFLGGPGSKVIIKWEVISTTNGIRFETRQAKVALDNVKIHVKEARHSVLLPMITSVFQGRIKRQLEKQMGESIIGFMHDINDALSHAINAAAQQVASMKHQVKAQVENTVQGAIDAHHTRAMERSSSPIARPNSPGCSYVGYRRMDADKPIRPSSPSIRV